MTLGKNMLAILKTRRWSIAKLATETKLPKSTLHSWTVGQSAVNLEHLKRVAEVLGVSVHELVWGVPDPNEKVAGEVLKEIFSGDIRVTLHKIEKIGRAK